MRDGDWKLVSEANRPWELYNLADDPTELENLATSNPEKAAELKARWNKWLKESSSGF